MTGRQQLGVAAVALWLVTLPAWSGRYGLTVATQVLALALAGQAWNLLMGLAGQLSLGHALYVGLGGYAAAALYQLHGLNPWLGMLLAVLAGAVVAACIGALAFRRGIGGTSFALLTIACAEVARIAFAHFDAVGAAGGLFLPVAGGGGAQPGLLRGPPAMHYYLVLAFAAAVFGLVGALRNSRLGYAWRAVRDDETSAATCGVDVRRAKQLALVLSAALASLAGVLHAFQQNHLFPDAAFGSGRSIEILLAPVLGGVGTVFGPLVGAAVLTGLSEGLLESMRIIGWDRPGLKQVFHGVLLGAAVLFMRQGCWPALAHWTRLDGKARDARG